jgi:hypothetical protein
MVELNPEKYNRNINLLCPTCGGNHFESESGTAETVEILSCARCKRKMTKDDLIEANSENVSEHINEIRRELVEDVREQLKRAFSNNKFFKIR